MVPHGVCFKCVAGIQTQMRIIAASTEDNEEDKVGRSHFRQAKAYFG